MNAVSFSDEEARVLKEIAAGDFHGADPGTVKNLVLRGFLTAGPESQSPEITRTGRLALEQFLEQHHP
jgi:hypothetical protein